MNYQPYSLHRNYRAPQKFRLFPPQHPILAGVGELLLAALFVGALIFIAGMACLNNEGDEGVTARGTQTSVVAVESVAGRAKESAK